MVVTGAALRRGPLRASRRHRRQQDCHRRAARAARGACGREAPAATGPRHVLDMSWTCPGHVPVDTQRSAREGSATRCCLGPSRGHPGAISGQQRGHSYQVCDARSTPFADAVFGGAVDKGLLDAALCSEGFDYEAGPPAVGRRALFPDPARSHLYRRASSPARSPGCSPTEASG